MPKVSFAIDEMAGTAAAAAEGKGERMGTSKGKVGRASRTVGKVERTGMWASIKHDSEPTAQQSLHLVAARHAGAHLLNEHAGVRAWTVAFYSKFPSTKRLTRLITNSSIRPLKKWLRGFTAAGRAARIEQDWEDAVKRAHATQEFHEHKDDLNASRARHDRATGSAVSSALGHRQTFEPEITVSKPLPSVSPAGSIFSNEKIVFPTPIERSASQIITPGLRQLRPTPPRSVDTLEFEASGPTEIYQPHAIFRDPEHAKFTSLTARCIPREVRSRDADCFDLVYFSAPDQDEPFDQFNEITTSYSDSLKDYLPMCKSKSSLDAADRMMHGDGDGMVLFGRWRHHKDAPLSLVKEMIEQELRGPGARSLYGPGGLKTSDHPLVHYYNERIRRLYEQESSNVQESETPLSPVLLQGNTAAQRFMIRSSTPVTFSMDKEGTFITTGFHIRTASTGSTVESVSPIENPDLVAHGAQEDARRDSGVHGVQLGSSSRGVRDATGNTSLGNYDILRRHTPDPTLNYKTLNEQTDPEYNREHSHILTIPYINQHCRSFIRNASPATLAALPLQQGPHPRNTQNLAHHDTPQHQASQMLYNRSAGRGQGVKLGLEPQRFHSRRPGQQDQRNFTARPHQVLQALYNRNAGRGQELKLGHEPQQFHSRRPGQQDQRNFTARHQHEALQYQASQMLNNRSAGRGQDVKLGHEPQRFHSRRPGQEVKLGHEPQRFHSRRPGQQGQRDYTACHQQEAPPTRNTQHQQCQTFAQQNEAFKMEQPKGVRFNIPKYVKPVVPAPQDHRVILAAPEDAEDAMMSEDEDTVVDTKEAPKINITSSSTPASPSSKGLPNKEFSNNASEGVSRTILRSVSKTGFSDVAVSNSSSVASATDKETAGLNASTELTPVHATPGTTASSGDARHIKSPARAQSLGGRLSERLKQIETRTSDENEPNDISL